MFEHNEFKILPVQEAINSRYPEIRFLVQVEQDGVLVTPRSRVGRQIAYGLVVALFFISLLIVLMVWYVERRGTGVNP